MSCKSKIKHTCGDKTYATCVFYSTEVPSWSELINEGCVVTEETTKELYQEVTKLRDKTDFSSLSTTCPDITIETENGVVTPLSYASTTLKLWEELKCPTTEEVITQDIDITGYGLDFKCLVDPCGDPITKLSQLLQIMIDQHCP